MRKRTILIVVLGTIVLNILSGCGQNIGSNSDWQEYPASTNPVLNHVEECFYFYFRAQDNYNDAYDACIERDDPQEDCWAGYENSRDVSREGWIGCLRNLPTVSQECIDRLDPLSTENDADEDGVADWYEYIMGTNPCEPCSSGGHPGENCDGDFDFDRDGIPNAEDEFPICDMEHADPRYCV